MADQDLNLFAATTDILDADIIAVRKNSDGVWRKITGADLRLIKDTVTAKAFKSQIGPLSIADDAVADIDFSADTRGIMIVTGNVGARGQAVVFFRVGAINEAQLLASHGSVAVSTVFLGGTTGVDGDLTISARDIDRIHIENRTGASGSYEIAILATNGGEVAAL